MCTTIQLEIEYDRCARSTILPQVGLMILALGSFGLDIDRSFISLNVGGESGGSSGGSHLKIQGSHFKS